jgi:hypothetical protein
VQSLPPANAGGSVLAPFRKPACSSRPLAPIADKLIGKSSAVAEALAVGGVYAHPIAATLCCTLRTERTNLTPEEEHVADDGNEVVRVEI